MGDLRSVSEHFGRVDTTVEAVTLQEGTVIAQRHRLAGEVARLVELNAVVLPMLGGLRQKDSEEEEEDDQSPTITIKPWR